MDWAPHEMSTGAMFGSWFINDQILNTEQVTVADSERLESLVDTPCGSYYCEMCDKRFGRLQELTRHKSQVHHPPRHCPFCPYLWKRPDKIKNHILYTHPEFSHKTLKGLRGKDIVEFLNTYENLSRDVIPQAGGSSALLFPVPTEETTELPILPHPLPDYDIGGA
ncbi:hypothetical protein EDB89DRAFT_482440 [Lactarius sanguifluus]|nr:hypothetical protein EDB89DRAFT_482440 [Lactarius sanguifluus]